MGMFVRRDAGVFFTVTEPADNALLPGLERAIVADCGRGFWVPGLVQYSICGK